MSQHDIAKFFRDPPEVDVLLLTVKEVEWTATLRAFGVAAGESPIKVGRADEVYVVERNGLVFGIAFIGFAGNVESAMRVAELVTNVRFKAAILIGMAAGPRGEVHLGDVVISESVIAYEYVTLTAAGPILSPVVHTVPMRRVRLARTISQIDPAWKHRLRTEIRGCDDFVEIPDDEVEKLDETWACNVRTGAILAGAKLIEDGSLQQMTQDFGDRIKAAEMEGAGFAAMCSEAGIEWLVVRGICDYGEPNRRKGWQFAGSSQSRV